MKQDVIDLISKNNILINVSQKKQKNGSVLSIAVATNTAGVSKGAISNIDLDDAIEQAVTAVLASNGNTFSPIDALNDSIQSLEYEIDYNDSDNDYNDDDDIFN